MDQDRRILTHNMRKLPTTGIRAVDDVHNFIYDLRLKGKPISSVKLRPLHFSMYVFWVASVAGRDKVYNSDGVIAAPIECDGVQILEGDRNQFAEILPNFLPMDEKTVDKAKEFQIINGKMPENYSQLR